VKTRKAVPLQYRKNLFLVTLTLIPLTAFVIHSIQGQPKLNWTGQVWLAILPLIAARISRISIGDIQNRMQSLTRRWAITAPALLIFYAGGFGYLVAGMPGLTKGSGMTFPIAWKAYGKRIEEIETRLKSETGKEPLTIGLDKYWLSSEASFYDSADGDDLPEVAGESLVGGNSLMWNSWMPPHAAAGRLGLLVSFTRDKLEQDWVNRRFSDVTEIKKEILTNFGGEIGHFYWRTGYNYRPDF